MPEKILYISDLDGTLLKKDVSLSEFTVKTVNELIGKGMIFSFATARSRYTSSKLTRELNISAPVVIYNGTCICDLKSGKKIVSNDFSRTEAKHILDMLLDKGVFDVHG